MSDEDVIRNMEKDLEEQEEKKRQGAKRKSVSAGTKKLLAGVVGSFVLYTAWVGFNKGMMIAAGVVVGVIYFGDVGDTETKKMGERDLSIKMYKDLRWYQTNPFGNTYRINPGRLSLNPHCAVPEFTTPYGHSDPWYREVGVTVDTNGIKKVYSVQQELNYPGNIIGISERAGGFKGTEISKKTWVPSAELKAEKFKDKFLNKQRR